MQCKRPRVQGLRVPLGSMMQASKGPRAPRSKGAIGLNDLWALLAPWALGLLTPGRPRLKGSLKTPWIHGSRLGPLGPWVLGPLGAQKGSRVQESNYPGIEGNKVLPPPAPAARIISPLPRRLLLNLSIQGLSERLLLFPPLGLLC